MKSQRQRRRRPLWLTSCRPTTKLLDVQQQPSSSVRCAAKLAAMRASVATDFCRPASSRRRASSERAVAASARRPRVAGLRAAAGGRTDAMPCFLSFSTAGTEFVKPKNFDMTLIGTGWKRKFYFISLLFFGGPRKTPLPAAGCTFSSAAPTIGAPRPRPPRPPPLPPPPPPPPRPPPRPPLLTMRTRVARRLISERHFERHSLQQLGDELFGCLGRRSRARSIWLPKTDSLPSALKDGCELSCSSVPSTSCKFASPAFASTETMAAGNVPYKLRMNLRTCTVACGTTRLSAPSTARNMSYRIISSDQREEKNV